MSTTKRFQITSLDCVNYGVYNGATAEEAFSAMERDGGGSAGDITGWIIREVMSRTAARRTAHRESHMYRDSVGQWVVLTTDNGESRRDAHESRSSARNALATWRRERAAQLSGEPRFTRADGRSGNGYLCDLCGGMWLDHVAPGCKCPS